MPVELASGTLLPESSAITADIRWNAWTIERPDRATLRGLLSLDELATKCFAVDHCSVFTIDDALGDLARRSSDRRSEGYDAVGDVV